jgi:hypothetical protein
MKELKIGCGNPTGSTINGFPEEGKTALEQGRGEENGTTKVKTKTPR